MVKRGTLVRIETKQHERLFRLVRHNNTGEGYALYLEYDDRLALGVNTAEDVLLHVRKAYRIEYAFFLWRHTDPIVSIEFRLAVFLTIVSVCLGAVVGFAL